MDQKNSICTTAFNLTYDKYIKLKLNKKLITKLLSKPISINIKKMLTLYQEMICIISEFLVDKEKIRLTMISRLFDKLKYVFIYREKVNINKIIKLSYFDNFENIEMNVMGANPKNAKYIHYVARRGDIPKFITHLTIGTLINQSKIFIPLSVTHLTFSSKFNELIYFYIPPSVTHLEFGYCFDKSIEGNIPSSVTHLTFGLHFNQSIDDIPLSVIDIKINRAYRLSINDNVISRVNITRV